MGSSHLVCVPPAHHLHQNHQGHHHETMMIKKKNILLLFCASVLVLVVASARPQTQLKWNWEEVILSRNGPSTTTTPRPTRWTTTTLRFLDIAPVVKAGSVGTVEDAYLVPRPGPRKKPQIAELSSAASQNSGKISLALMLVPMLIIMNI